MPRKEQKIKAVGYVHVGDRLVDTADLDPVQKQELSTWIRCTYLNALFEGKAKFYPMKEGKMGRCLLEEQWEQCLFRLKRSPQQVGRATEGG